MTTGENQLCREAAAVQRANARILRRRETRLVLGGFVAMSTMLATSWAADMPSPDLSEGILRIALYVAGVLFGMGFGARRSAQQADAAAVAFEALARLPVREVPR